MKPAMAVIPRSVWIDGLVNELGSYFDLMQMCAQNEQWTSLSRLADELSEFSCELKRAAKAK